MNFFNERDSGIKTVNSTFVFSEKHMSKDKMCYEIVWLRGSGYLGACFGLSRSVYIRYSHSNSDKCGSGSISVTISDSKFSAEINVPMLLCFDKSDIPKLKFIDIKGSNKITFLCSYASAKRESK